MTTQNNLEQGRQTVIDTKFPLTWLIGCTCAIVFSMGGFAVKVSSFGESLSKIETKSDSRDEKAALLQQMVLIQQGKNETQQAELTRAVSDISDIKRDVEEMKRKQTWAPK